MFCKVIKFDDIPEKLFNIGEKVYFKKNDFIIKRGDAVDYIYILTKGKIIIFTLNESGSVYCDYLLVSPCSFGEEFAINPQKTGSTFKCLEDCELVRISRKEFINIMKTDFDINLYLYNLNTFKFTISSFSAYKRATLSSEDMVVQVLIEFAEIFGKKIDGKIKINYKITQQFISELANVKRLTTVRILNKLKNDDIIEFKKGNYYINDIDYLKKIAQYE